MKVGDRIYFENGQTGMLATIVKGDDELQQVDDDDKAVVLVVRLDDESGYQCVPLFDTSSYDAATIEKMKFQ